MGFFTPREESWWDSFKRKALRVLEASNLMFKHSLLLWVSGPGLSWEPRGSTAWWGDSDLAAWLGCRPQTSGLYAVPLAFSCLGQPECRSQSCGWVTFNQALPCPCVGKGTLSEGLGRCPGPKQLPSNIPGQDVDTGSAGRIEVTPTSPGSLRRLR